MVFFYSLSHFKIHYAQKNLRLLYCFFKQKNGQICLYLSHMDQMMIYRTLQMKLKTKKKENVFEN